MFTPQKPSTFFALHPRIDLTLGNFQSRAPGAHFRATFSKLDKVKGNIVSVPGLDVGKRGLEKFFDKELRGEFGRKRNEVTSKGLIIDSQIYEETKSGNDIQVALDMSLQAYAIERLERGNYKLT